MESWDAQMLLDMYIYDYLVRKNLRLVADVFANEASFSPRPVALVAPEGFLLEWWSFFWDLYSAKLAKHARPIPGCLLPKVTEKAGCVLQNFYPVLPVPDVKYMPQNTGPAMPMTGLTNLAHTVNPTTMPMTDLGDTLQSIVSTMMTRTEFSPNRLGSTPPSDLNSNLHGLNVDQLACKLPSLSSPCHQQEKVNNKWPPSPTRGNNFENGLRLSPIDELTHAPKLSPYTVEPTDTARPVSNFTLGFNYILHLSSRRAKVGNQILSEGLSLIGGGYAENIPVPNQQNTFSVLSACFRQDSTPGLAAKELGSTSENSANMGASILVDNSSKQNDSQIEKDSEIENPLDKYIESFLSNGEAPDDMYTSPGQTSPQCSSALKMFEQQGFSFDLIRSFHPTKNKLLCCDFSTPGEFLAAAGHEKKVFIWNLKQSSRKSVLAHSQLITDIRFKPDSNIFATSSFDRSVKIWDAANTGKVLFDLVGHAEHVTSVDFHPRQGNLLCSCDGNNEIRLWNIKESGSCHSFKGAYRQVRLQPQQGNLLAAATGNVINLIDLETSVIQNHLEGHAKDVRSICWDISGQYLVSVSEDSARIWSIVSGAKCIHELHSSGNKFECCTFHPAYAQVVAVGSYQSIDIWNPSMGNRTWNSQAHDGIVSALAHSSDNNIVASVSHDQWVRLWK